MKLFLAHAALDEACADSIASQLKDRGYAVESVRSAAIDPEAASFLLKLENEVLPSAATIVIWSRSAARDELVELTLLAARELARPIFALVRDDTRLPGAWGTVEQYPLPEGCHVLPEQLLPQLPFPEDDRLDLQILANLASPLMRVRRSGIQRAAELIAADRFAAPLRAGLRFIARHDLTDTMRRLASEALGESEQEADEAQAEEIVAVRCANGTIQYFKKHRLCADHTQFPRQIRRIASATVHDIEVNCGGEQIVITLDCEDYL